METKPKLSHRRRLFNWLTSRRTLRRAAIVAAWVISLTALTYGVIDWNGRRAWNEFRQDYEKRVASLDLSTYIPKEIPDAENFAATPLAAAWLTNRNNTNTVLHRDLFGSAGDLIPSHQNHIRQYVDLAAWKEAFAGSKQAGRT